MGSRDSCCACISRWPPAFILHSPLLHHPGDLGHRCPRIVFWFFCFSRCQTALACRGILDCSRGATCGIDSYMEELVLAFDAPNKKRNNMTVEPIGVRRSALFLIQRHQRLTP